MFLHLSASSDTEKKKVHWEEKVEPFQPILVKHDEAKETCENNFLSFSLFNGYTWKVPLLFSAFKSLFKLTYVSIEVRW